MSGGSCLKPGWMTILPAMEPGFCGLAAGRLGFGFGSSVADIFGWYRRRGLFTRELYPGLFVMRTYEVRRFSGPRQVGPGVYVPDIQKLAYCGRG